MKGYNIDIKQEDNCSISEVISIAEVPVTVIDNRTGKDCEIMFYIVIDEEQEYCVRDKVRKICDRLGYNVWKVSEAIVRKTEASQIFMM